MTTTDPNDILDLGAKHLQEAEGPLKAALGDDAGDILATVKRSLSTAAQQSAPVAEQVQEHLANDLIPAEARQRLAREAAEAGRKAVSDAGDQTAAAIDVARRKLEQAALPKVPKDAAEVALLRDEIRTVLDAADDPYGEAVAMVTNDPQAAAVLNTSWGHRILAAKGVKDAATPLRLAAIQGAAEYGDDRQKAAARALDGAIVSLIKAQASYVGAAGLRLDEIPRGV